MAELKPGDVVGLRSNLTVKYTIVRVTKTKAIGENMQGSIEFKREVFCNGISTYKGNYSFDGTLLCGYQLWSQKDQDAQVKTFLHGDICNMLPIDDWCEIDISIPTLEKILQLLKEDKL